MKGNKMGVAPVNRLLLPHNDWYTSHELLHHHSR
jgi:hypothetical protein